MQVNGTDKDAEIVKLNMTLAEEKRKLQGLMSAPTVRSAKTLERKSSQKNENLVS